MREIILKKLKTTNFPEIKYYLEDVCLNDLVGKKVSFEFTGRAFCLNCNKELKKTYSQGYCYPCSMSLARCDLCILKPETCHYHLGTCREPEWGEQNCFQSHSIYLANTAGIKIGITRSFQKHTRWADQGAVAAVEVARVDNRLQAGLFEVALKDFFSDKTDWRKLITGVQAEVDLVDEWLMILDDLPEECLDSILDPDQLEVEELIYPVLGYPAKAKTFNIDKNQEISGELKGIRGQYLLFADQAINIRKFQGYEICFS